MVALLRGFSVSMAHKVKEAQAGLGKIST